MREGDYIRVRTDGDGRLYPNFAWFEYMGMVTDGVCLIKETGRHDPGMAVELKDLNPLIMYVLPFEFVNQ